MIETENGRTYSTVRGSDLERDGMVLELQHGSGAALAEIFYSDQTHEFTFTEFAAEPIPLAILQKLIEEARRDLPAMRRG